MIPCPSRSSAKSGWGTASSPPSRACAGRAAQNAAARREAEPHTGHLDRSALTAAMLLHDAASAITSRICAATATTPSRTFRSATVPPIPRRRSFVPTAAKRTRSLSIRAAVTRRTTSRIARCVVGPGVYWCRMTTPGPWTYNSRRRMMPDVMTRAVWPVDLDAISAARDRIRPFVPVSPLRSYPVLDAEVGHGISVFVKHENFNPTNSFKVRNAFSLVTALSDEERRRGIVAATRGNHGLGLAYAGTRFGVPVTICVPLGNNPDKNAGMRALGVRLIEEGRDYDESLTVANRIVEENDARLAHSTNDPHIIAGAGTMSLEIAEQAPELDALVIAVGGGSQAVGAMVVMRALHPNVRVYAVQAAGASATHDGWHAGEPRVTASATTIADGLATRSSYDLTFSALREGLADFITVTDAEIANAMRVLLRSTHSLVEGAGAAGMAGLLALRDRLAGQRVGVVLSGGNVDERTLRQVLTHEI